MNKTIDIMRDLINVSDYDHRVLQAVSGDTARWSDAFVADVYDAIYTDPAMQAAFADAGRAAIEDMLEAWFLALATGEYDDFFWDQQATSVMRHIERGVPVTYLLGMVHHAQRFFLERAHSIVVRRVGAADHRTRRAVQRRDPRHA